MKLKIVLGVAAILLLLIDGGADTLRVGNALPRVDLLKDGTLVSLQSQIQGKTLVHIFASW